MNRIVLTALALALLAPAAMAREGKTADGAKAKRAQMEAVLKTKVISIDFKDASLKEVVKFLQITTGINMVIDPAVYEAYDEDALRVTLKIEELPAGNILDLILRFKKLEKVWRYGVLLITTRESALERVVMRLYDVRDLNVPLKDFPGVDIELKSGNDGMMMSPDFGGPMDEQPKHYSTEEIVDLIREHTGDGSWNENPKCRITIFKGMLIVVQTEKVHKEIFKLLNHLRRTR